MTLPEVKLWQALRGNETGFKFRRQYPIGPYVVDFCCLASRLVIEIDGQGHDRGAQPMRDAVRDRFLEENGFRVLRVGAKAVLREIEAVVAAIVAHAARPLHPDAARRGPPPRSGEE